MMDLLLGMFIGWALVTVFIALIGFMKYVDAKFPVQKRDGARMMFGAPAWFIVGVILAARNVRQAWRDADWEKLK